jgi:protein required for attachment to host cells
MQFAHDTIIAVTDGTKLRMFRNTGDELRLMLVELPQPDVHGTAGAGHHKDPDRHEVSYEAAVAKWLNHEIVTGKIGQLFVIAPPRAMGELRQHYSKLLQEKLVGELTKEHTHDSLQVLEQVLKDLK